MLLHSFIEGETANQKLTMTFEVGHPMDDSPSWKMVMLRSSVNFRGYPKG